MKYPHFCGVFFLPQTMASILIASHENLFYKLMQLVICLMFVEDNMRQVLLVNSSLDCYCLQNGVICNRFKIYEHLRQYCQASFITIISFSGWNYLFKLRQEFLYLFLQYLSLFFLAERHTLLSFISFFSKDDG